MKKSGIVTALVVISISLLSSVKNQDKGIADPSDYLGDIKEELKIEWPNNRTITLTFHGHSVPAGYYKTPVVKPFGAYPLMLLRELKEIYPHAVINIINTSIGGENSVSGAERFNRDVLVHKPDVLFLDYSLNDRGVGLDKSKEAWESMIRLALDEGIKIILLTPSPDTRTGDLLEPDCELDLHAKQVTGLAEEYGLGLVDSYSLFRNKVIEGDSLWTYMSSVVHPNEKGHQLIVKGIMKYFE